MTYEIDLAQAEDDFRAELRATGLVPPDALEGDGKLHRIDAEEKPGKKDGWYVLHFDGIPAGAWGDWHDPSVKHTWCARKLGTLSAADRATHLARMKAAQAQRDAEGKRKAAEAARKAQALLDASQPASNAHPYAAPKLLALPATVREIDLPDAVRILGYPPRCEDELLEGRLLVVPVYIDGALSTVELIDGQKRKHAIAGGKKTGGHWTTADLPDGDGAGLTIIIAEGMATTVSASMATGYLGVAALCCGNLMAVGKMLRKRYQHAKIVFVADLGIGVTKSTEAARAVDGFVAIPTFGDQQ